MKKIYISLIIGLQLLNTTLLQSDDTSQKDSTEKTEINWTRVTAPSEYVGTCWPGSLLKQKDACDDWCGGSENVMDYYCSQNVMNCGCKPGAQVGAHNIFTKAEAAFNDAWNSDIGKKIRSGVATATDWATDQGKKIADATLNCLKDPKQCAYDIKEDFRKLINLIGAGIGKANAIGDSLIKGADQLESSPTLLRSKGVDGLQTKLVGGLQTDLMPILVAKASEIAQNRSAIAKFNKLISDNKNIAEDLGKGQLVNDLLAGFNAADAALGALWSGPDLSTQLPNASGPTSKTGFGALRHRVETQAIQSQDSYKDALKKAIAANNDKGILSDLLTAGQDAIDTTKATVETLSNQIMQLQQKINNKGFCIDGPKINGIDSFQCDLPGRLRALGKFLKSLPSFKV